MAAASAATVPRSAPAEPAAPPRRGLRALQLRILSSLVLAPVAIGAVWFGWPWLPLLTAAAAAVMAWEWGRLCRAERSGTVALAAMHRRILACSRAAWFWSPSFWQRSSRRRWRRPGSAIGLSVAGAATVFMLAGRERRRRARWLASGALWIALPCVLLLWLAQRDGAGRATLLWMLAIVWATDIGAYGFGSRLGGPRLAPRWSPRKTWAGLLGGIFCAALVGWADRAAARRIARFYPW